MSSKRRPGATCDLEEVRPGLFIVHNPAIGPLLRGEGDREGDRFRLTTWRRDGLVARLRSRAFEVVILADQIADLRQLPPAQPPGEVQWRPLASGERLSHFAPRPPGWAPVPLAADDPPRAELRQGWALRRRRGRGPFSYYRVLGGGLAPLTEDEAVALGYAQAALSAPLEATLVEEADGWLLPDLPLPTAHRMLLGRIAEKRRDGWLVPADGLELARALLGRLGVTTPA